MIRAPRSYWAGWVARQLAFGAAVLYLALGTTASEDWGRLLTGFMTLGGLGLVASGLRTAHLWWVGWGFTADAAGLQLRRGRRSEQVGWQEIDQVELHDGIGWARLHLRFPDRTVVVPHPPATARQGDRMWRWIHRADGWRIDEADPPASFGPVGGDWVRGLRLGSARRGYAPQPVVDFLERCAASLDVLAAGADPPPGVELVSPDDVDSFEVSLARGGFDPDQVDQVLEVIHVRLTDLYEGSDGAPPS